MKVLIYKKSGENEVRRTKDLPDSWNIKSFSMDLNEIINCRSCGKKITFGEAYTSHEVFTLNGMWGYGVCPDCYRKERRR